MDERLISDSEYICDLKLCQLRLNRDGDLDWFILIPKRENLVELIDLDSDEQVQLMKEIDYVSRILKEYSCPDKINVANLGNIVSQLHIHVLARYKTDRAWPGPIWGTLAQKNFDDNNVKTWKERFI